MINMVIAATLHVIALAHRAVRLSTPPPILPVVDGDGVVMG